MVRMFGMGVKAEWSHLQFSTTRDLNPEKGLSQGASAKTQTYHLKGTILGIPLIHLLPFYIWQWTSASEKCEIMPWTKLNAGTQNMPSESIPYCTKYTLDTLLECDCLTDTHDGLSL